MNHAHIGNLVFERGEEESVPDFRQRARDAVAELGGGVLAWGAPDALEWVEAEPEIITISGGLTDGVADIATIGAVQIERAPDETVEAFRARAHEAPVAAGSDHIVFGGLRPMPMDGNDDR
jgi:hypothetical protein